MARDARQRRAGQDGGSGHALGGGRRAGRPRRPCASPIACSAGSRASTMRSMPCWSGCRRWSSPPAREIVVETTIDAEPAAPRPGARAERAHWRRARAPRPARPALVLRPGGRHARAGRRPLLCREPVQSRAEGQAPARLGVQDVRLPGGAGKRHQARQHGPGSADPRARAGARATRAPAIAAPSPCAMRSPCR